MEAEPDNNPKTMSTAPSETQHDSIVASLALVADIQILVLHLGQRKRSNILWGQKNNVPVLCGMH